jgi:hypothetical protein
LVLRPTSPKNCVNSLQGVFGFTAEGAENAEELTQLIESFDQ